MQSKSAIVLLTIAIVFAIGLTSIYFFGDYGWTVFVFVPFLMGVLPSYLASKRLELSKGQCFILSFIALFVSELILLICGIEGVVCIIMALPILMIITWISAYIGYLINNRKSKFSRAHATIILAFYSLSFLSFDYINEPYEEPISVRTSIVVNAPIQTVWKNMLSFDTIAKQEDFFFELGIASPINATISGTGVGAIRYANFTTGSFVEPVTIWDEPNLLQFSVESNPAGIRELSPFLKVRPPHLEGYFKSYKGQFKLKKIGENATLLEGTNWYKVDVYPQLYWKLWADAIIHKVHYQVLENIKSRSELENLRVEK